MDHFSLNSIALVNYPYQKNLQDELSVDQGDLVVLRDYPVQGWVRASLIPSHQLSSFPLDSSSSIESLSLESGWIPVSILTSPPQKLIISSDNHPSQSRNRSKSDIPAPTRSASFFSQAAHAVDHLRKKNNRSRSYSASNALDAQLSNQTLDNIRESMSSLSKLPTSDQTLEKLNSSKSLLLTVGNTPLALSPAIQELLTTEQNYCADMQMMLV
jgi:hypothetical protein